MAVPSMDLFRYFSGAAGESGLLPNVEGSFVPGPQVPPSIMNLDITPANLRNFASAFAFFWIAALFLFSSNSILFG